MSVVLDSILWPAGVHSFVMRTIFSHTHATKLAHFALKLRLQLYLGKIHAMKALK